MIFEGFFSGSFESYQLYLSLWLMNYCKVELGKTFCYQLYSDPTFAASGHLSLIKVGLPLFSI